MYSREEIDIWWIILNFERSKLEGLEGNWNPEILAWMGIFVWDYWIWERILFEIFLALRSLITQRITFFSKIGLLLKKIVFSGLKIGALSLKYQIVPEPKYHIYIYSIPQLIKPGHSKSLGNFVSSFIG